MRIVSLQSLLKTFLVLLLAVSQAAYAVMIEPQPVPAPGAMATAQGSSDQLERDRARVREFMERATVKERLQALGVSGLTAQSRVDALTPEEVHAMAQRIDTMAAGGALSQQDWILILLVAILLVVAL